MLLGLYPLIQGAGTEKPCPAYFDCWHIANTGETHQSFRMHSAQEDSGLASLQQGFEVYVFHKIHPQREPWVCCYAISSNVPPASKASTVVCVVSASFVSHSIVRRRFGTGGETGGFLATGQFDPSCPVIGTGPVPLSVLAAKTCSTAGSALEFLGV
jgi:hypothetical protein